MSDGYLFGYLWGTFVTIVGLWLTGFLHNPDFTPPTRGE